MFTYESSEDHWDEDDKVYRCYFKDHGSSDIIADENQYIDIC